VVIAGDIRVKLCDVELLSIQLRLLICSVEKARELGIGWWWQEPARSDQAVPQTPPERQRPPLEPNAEARTPWEQYQRFHRRRRAERLSPTQPLPSGREPA
jgi:hypothetical protein